jgi:hypothetical protein
MNEFPPLSEEEWDIVIDALDSALKDKAFQISADESVKASVRAIKKVEAKPGEEVPVFTEAEFQKISQSEINFAKVKLDFRAAKEQAVMIKAKLVALKNSLVGRSLTDEIDRMTR